MPKTRGGSAAATGTQGLLFLIDRKAGIRGLDDVGRPKIGLRSL